MKHLTFALIGAFLITTSCQKETITTEQETSKTNQSIDKSSQIYIDEDGNSIDYDYLKFDLPDYVFVVESYDEVLDEYTNRYFESEDKLYIYSKAHPNYAFITRKIEQVKEIRALALVTGDINLENETDQLSSEMNDLLRQIELENNPSNDRGAALLHAAIPNSNVFPLVGQPQFSLFSFRNKAVLVSGLSTFNRLWKRTWFRGGSVIVIPIFGPVHLSSYMYQDAESAQ